MSILSNLEVGRRLDGVREVEISSAPLTSLAQRSLALHHGWLGDDSAEEENRSVKTGS